ncbi:MAG: ORF6N domain-containing protein [Candidatus Aadella gelida]|nr:ORF6N domain-containing protein [Candidatus Aadella gelida]
MKKALITSDQISSKIIQLRGKSVMIDRDLANLYGTSTKTLNQAVKRNLGRFPSDFMFVLTKNEKTKVVTNCDHLKELKFSHTLPRAFTEQGIAMLSSVLNSDRAIQVNIQIMRAFVSLRRMVITYGGLKRKIESIEKKYDAQFKMVFTAIKQLISHPPPKTKRRIGFHGD